MRCILYIKCILLSTLRLSNNTFCNQPLDRVHRKTAWSNNHNDIIDTSTNIKKTHYLGSTFQNIWPCMSVVGLASNMTLHEGAANWLFTKKRPKKKYKNAGLLISYNIPLSFQEKLRNTFLIETLFFSLHFISFQFSLRTSIQPLFFLN